MFGRGAASLRGALLSRSTLAGASSTVTAPGGGAAALGQRGSIGSRAFAGGSDFKHSNRQAILAKAYLREYVKAKNNGNISEAMRLLEKATVASKHVHVWLPDSGKSGEKCLVPLAAIVPSFSHDEEGDPRCVLPISVDGSSSEPVQTLPLRSRREISPVPLVLPFDPSGASGNGIC